MILVLLGTQNNDFSRLLSEIDNCITNGTIKEDVIVQKGHSNYKSSNMKIFDFIEKDQIDDLISKSNLIITHGGVGSIMKCVKLGKKVIAVPRLKKYGEHVNDHQIQIVENFSNSGYITGLFEIENLTSVLENIDTFTPIPFENNNSQIIDLIADYINNN